MTLLNDADALYVGSRLVDAVHAGAAKAWPPGLSKMGSLRDTFDSGAFDLSLWVPNGDVAAVNGQVVMDASTDFSYLASANQYDLTKSSIAVEVISNLSAANAYPVAVTDITGGAYYAFWWVQNGLVQAWYNDDAATGPDVMLGEEPYDWLAYRFFRIREHAGRLLWEHSHNGRAWTTDYSGPDSFDVTALLAGTYAVPPASVVVIDNVNSPPPKVGTLVDGFDGDVLDPMLWDPSGDVSIVDGQLVLDNAADYSGMFSHNLYDATESSLSVELVSGSAAYVPLLGDVTNADHYVYWWIQEGLAQAWYKDPAMANDAMLWQGPYDPVAYRFLRIREHAGRTFWEHSPDGHSWVTDYDQPNLIDMTALLASSFGIPPAIVVLDNVNVAP